MYLGKNLQYLRKRSNITQEQLAEGLGVSRQAVSKWEAGQSYPEMDKLLLLCNLFGCTMDELVRDDLKQRNFTPVPAEDAPVIMEPEAAVGTQAPPDVSESFGERQPEESTTEENSFREDTPADPEPVAAVTSDNGGEPERRGPFVPGEGRVEAVEHEPSYWDNSQGAEDDAAVFAQYNLIMDRFSLTTALGVMLMIWGVAAETYMEDFLGRGPEGLPLVLSVVVGAGLIAFGFFSLQRFKMTTPPVPQWFTVEERANYRVRFGAGITEGIVFILAGLFAVILEDYMAMSAAVDSIFLMLVGVGVAILIYTCLSRNKLKVEEFNRSLSKNPEWRPSQPDFKSLEKMKGRITAMIMPVAIAVYLVAGMFFNLWHPLWVILPIGALLCGLVPVIDKPVAAAPIVGLILFFVLGIFFNMWHPGWAVVVIAALLSGLISVQHEPAAVAPVLGLILFFIAGPFFGLWHPGWVLIPLGGMVSGIISIARKN